MVLTAGGVCRISGCERSFRLAVERSVGGGGGDGNNGGIDGWEKGDGRKERTGDGETPNEPERLKRKLCEKVEGMRGGKELIEKET